MLIARAIAVQMRPKEEATNITDVVKKLDFDEGGRSINLATKVTRDIIL